MEKFPIATGSAEAIADFGILDNKVDPQKIRAQLATIADELGKLFTQPLGLPLKSLEVALTLTAEGSVSFLGTGGKLTGEGSITLTFEKPSAA